MIFLQAAMGFGLFLVFIIPFLLILWAILFISFGYYNQKIELEEGDEKLKISPLKHSTLIILILLFIIGIYLYFIVSADDFLKYS